jgi:hypothetical protein
MKLASKSSSSCIHLPVCVYHLILSSSWQDDGLETVGATHRDGQHLAANLPTGARCWPPQQLQGGKLHWHQLLAAEDQLV